jgi:hypothetical protein
LAPCSFANGEVLFAGVEEIKDLETGEMGVETGVVEGLLYGGSKHR